MDVVLSSRLCRDTHMCDAIWQSATPCSALACAYMPESTQQQKIVQNCVSAMMGGLVYTNSTCQQENGLRAIVSPSAVEAYGWSVMDQHSGVCCVVILLRCPQYAHTEWPHKTKSLSESTWFLYAHFECPYKAKSLCESIWLLQVF